LMELGRVAGVARALIPRSGNEVGRGPTANLALEEALFLKNEGLVLRVWENEESVIIGRGQLANFETDVDYCQAHRIPIVRRFTAGGAVYNGPGNVNWSVFVARSMTSGRLRYDSSPHSIFRVASRPILLALAASGVAAWLDPPNRILTSEGKISGIAAYVSRKGFLCHGTLLVAADLEKVRALTTPSAQAIERKYTRSRDTKTANAGLDVDSFIRNVVSTVADESGLAVETSAPEAEELELMRELVATRYSDVAWNLGDPFAWRDRVAPAVVR